MNRAKGRKQEGDCQSQFFLILDIICLIVTMLASDSHSSSSPPLSFIPHAPKETSVGPEEDSVSGNNVAESERLHRRLAARHLSMIAIGGALGTGLLIGTGTALERGGPGAVLLTYSLVGFVVYLMMCALGEMAAWLPIPSGFQGHAARFVDPAMGFALGYTYETARRDVENSE